MTRILRARSLLAIALSLAPCLGSAQTYRETPIQDDPSDSIVTRLFAAFTAHADAAGRWYVDALHGRQVTTAEFRLFERPFETATFASATYTYERDGRTHHRVYHARSGRNDLHTGIPGVEPRMPYTRYLVSDATYVLARDQHVPPGSDVTNRPVGTDRFPDARKRDAELKIARQVEIDLASGSMPRGGWLNVYTSQAPCPSCGPALRALAATADVRVHVAYLRHQSSAYTRFHRMRHAFMASVEGQVNGGHVNTLNLADVAMDHLQDQQACESEECENRVIEEGMLPEGAPGTSYPGGEEL